MGDLTENFSAWEFTCRHCGAVGVKPALVESLQALRGRLGVPIHISSGYRCQDHPLSLRRPGSKHLVGEAADIVATEMAPRAVAEVATEIDDFGAVAVDEYRGYVHVDVRKRPPVRWGYDADGNEIPA